MGLDQFVLVKADRQPAPHRVIGQWRKHPNLHGWMEDLWLDKGKPDGADGREFNCVELPLLEEDILFCMEAIQNKQLPHTEGFFFGDEDEWSEDERESQRQEDLAIMKECLAEVQSGREVIYDSWW